MVKWYHFVQSADQFLIAYACSCTAAMGHVALLFLASHAAELYLKGCRVKQGLAPHEAAKYAHNMGRLISDCMHSDPAFPRDFELKQNVRAVYARHGGMMSEAFWDELGGDAQHFADLQELYEAAYLQGDLKYYGLPSRSGFVQLLTITPSPMWERFFRSLRLYLAFPPDRVHDILDTTLKCGGIPPGGDAFLRHVAWDRDSEAVPPVPQSPND